MLVAVRNYFVDLFGAVGFQWTRFWFQPRGSWHLALLRQLVGLLALLWLSSFSFELTALFGTHGLVSLESVHQVMTNGDPTVHVPGFSHFFFQPSDSLMWMAHVVCLLLLVAVTLGLFLRVTVPLALVVVLSYIHRGPMLTGLFEPVLCMLLLYLVWAPSDGLAVLLSSKHEQRESWRATVVTRLIQLHLCGFYLLGGLSKLGSVVWWTGDAAWYLINDTQNRWVDITSINLHNYVLHGITQAWVLFELMFPLLIWIRRARPLLMFVSLVVWCWTGMMTGLIGFSALMIVANLAFVPAETVAAWFHRRRPDAEAA